MQQEQYQNVKPDFFWEPSLFSFPIETYPLVRRNGSILQR